jgi:3-dehydroquinate dehydratase/shikimate dehydrogenase
LISWHGPAPAPPALRSRLLQLLETPAAFYKLVPSATSAGEALVALELLEGLGRSDVVAFAAGEPGFWTRLVTPRLGAPLVYGSVGSTPGAPGQPTISRLVRDWGLPEQAPASRLYGVIGHPVIGSLSPRLHQAAYRALGLDALYLPFDADHFGDFWLEVVEGDLLGRLGLPLSGLSVTAPHKEIAYSVAGASSPLAARLQAANTLVRPRGVWEAESTDAEGVVAALVERGIVTDGRRVAVVGCGGAGRAAALGLSLHGAEVVLINRGEERGLAAARSLGLPFVKLEDLDPTGFDLFVHATPLGREADQEPALPVAQLADGCVVVDLVYREGPTVLVDAAKERWLIAVDGREVLLHQAVPQFRLMTGRELPMQAARAALGLEEPQ